MELETDMETAYVGRVIREGLPEEVTSRLKLAGGVGSSQVYRKNHNPCKRSTESKEVRTADKNYRGSLLGI